MPPEDLTDESGEDRLIARYFKPLAKHPGALGLIDDAASYSPPPGCDLVLTTDAIVAGVHYFADDSAETVARKALRVNLSDLAAKGAQPAGFLLTLALAGEIDDLWLEAFSRGLGADADAYACPLLGGDTTKTPGATTISITALGTLPAGTMVRRSGARVGDRIVVTGTIGDGALGLRLRRDSEAAARWRLDAAQRAHLTSRYVLPQPRNVLAEAVRLYAHAAMDVSDGLAGDLAKLCRASGVAAGITAERVPLSDAAREAVTAEPALVETVLGGGDDYEIIAAIPADAVAKMATAGQAAGVPVTEIGEVVVGSGEVRVEAKGQPMVLKQGSYSHF